MGARDIIEKQYLRNNERFADAFNYYIYNGKQIINPADLKEIGTDLMSDSGLWKGTRVFDS